ncbi:unnamed protein product [Owenia fusiformis]|uniref:Nuclear pore complex protein n=1 Tax=Owenia fusiformis TaxID=6347 RepID=A0A8J1T6Y8_OWEFU|nr:unnamed protein product [Owenia fusiformis]
MASNTRRSTRLSAEPGESTIRDIWQYSQKQRESFDPQAMNEALDQHRQSRQQIKHPSTSEKMSFSQLFGESPAPREELRSQAMKRRSMNVNLQKSLALLDEAVGTPGPSLRTKTPLKHSSYTPKQLPSASKFDVSGLLGPPMGRGMDVSVDMTTATPMRSFRADSTTPGRADVTTTNVALLLEEDPGLSASQSLFGDFLQNLKEHNSPDHIFDLVSGYESSCSEQVLLLKKLVKRTTPGQNKFSRTLNMLELLDQEKCTWRLLASLYEDRLKSQMLEEEDMAIDILNKYRSEKDIMTSLYERDAQLRQSQLVIDWLEKNAEEQLVDVYENIEFFTDQGGAWENTLHSLQKKSGGILSNSDRPLVNEMDPDAPIRQKRPIADLDREDELRLLKNMFTCLMAGQIEEAKRLCSKCGQDWRAATLEGWRLHNDPNYEKLGEGGEMIGVEGNPYRDVWKAVCWRMAEEESFSIYEKAIYASLSGNLKHILPACESWKDYLWAYYKTMVDNQVEQEIRLNSTLDRKLHALPRGYADKVLTPESVFMEIQSTANDKVRDECADKFHIIQKFIILEDIDGMIEQFHIWLHEESRLNRHLVRFMAHLVLFFRSIAMETKTELCVGILEAYVQDLIQDGHKQLIATYVSTLPENLQIRWYARFLEGITDKEERPVCLGYAEDAGLDIASITKMVVENIRNRDMAEFTIDSESALGAATSQEDRQKIEAIDWLVFDASQRAEALRQANAVMRTFLALKKHSAARDVFNKIPANSIDVIYRNWKMQTDSTELPPREENAIREYLCTQAYLDAHDSFNDWFEHYHNSKPAVPDVPQGTNFSERIAYEHMEKEYHQELDRWRHTLMIQTKATEEKMYNVLMFVNGGWMVDMREDDQMEESRANQMKLLRQLCLPTICFLLHTVLHITEQYKKAIQLADLIASEQHKLYLVFRKDELQKLLQKIRESSLILLDQQKGPLGYSQT